MACMFLPQWQSCSLFSGLQAVAGGMIYLDANATEPLRPQARAAAIRALDLPGNPSSVHAAGREARRVLEHSREIVAGCCGARPTQVIFTSGGTEACALAIAGLGRRRVLIGATEHDAIRAACPNAEILPVDPDGRVGLPGLARALEGGGPALVCLMLANNETGVLHPIAQAAALCAAHGAWLHVDAVQGPGRMKVSLAELGAHSLALSAHKAGGPKGAGALLLAEGVEIDAMIRGGGQEMGRRGGTPSLASVAGFAAALEAAQNAPSLAALRDRAERAALAHGAIVCGAAAARLGNTSCLALPGRQSDMQVIAMDVAGIAVSAGAACSSGKVARSHVLDAMGLSELAGCAIRVSLPWTVTEDDIAAFEAAYARLASRVGS